MFLMKRYTLLIALALTAAFACNGRPASPDFDKAAVDKGLDSLPKNDNPTQQKDEIDGGDVEQGEVSDPTDDDKGEPEPLKPEPVKPDPIKPDPVKPDPVKPEPELCQNLSAEKAFKGYVTITSGGKARKFFLTIPSNYNPKVPMPVVFGFHGRDYDGIRMRDYLDLEKFGEWALFVYPDALSRNWQGDTFIGWQNGPLGGKFGGGEDLIFVDDMIAYMKKRFCTDTKNYFATGQSWGGDFSNVVGCYKGSSFRAILPVAANGAYYLPKDAKSGDCTGNPAAWPMHSKTDEYFPVKLGEEYRDFWLKRNSCSQETTKLPINDDCFEYKGCAQSTRWCLYTGNHQVPRSYYSSEAVKFFRGFVGK